MRLNAFSFFDGRLPVMVQDGVLPRLDASNLYNLPSGVNDSPKESEEVGRKDLVEGALTLSDTAPSDFCLLDGNGQVMLPHMSYSDGDTEIDLSMLEDGETVTVVYCRNAGGELAREDEEFGPDDLSEGWLTIVDATPVDFSVLDENGEVVRPAMILSGSNTLVDLRDAGVSDGWTIAYGRTAKASAGIGSTVVVGADGFLMEPSDSGDDGDVLTAGPSGVSWTEPTAYSLPYASGSEQDWIGSTSRQWTFNPGKTKVVVVPYTGAYGGTLSFPTVSGATAGRIRTLEVWIKMTGDETDGIASVYVPGTCSLVDGESMPVDMAGNGTSSDFTYHVFVMRYFSSGSQTQAVVSYSHSFTGGLGI